MKVEEPNTSDTELSPVTGWTRRHWEVIADELLRGAEKHAGPRFSLINYGAERSQMHGLEGFARTFLLAAYRIRGTEGIGQEWLLERFSNGLVAGTSSGRSRERWPRIEDNSQAIVEAAFVALGLYETRRWIWDEMSHQEQESIVAWLSQVRGKRTAPNNWLLFQVIVETFLGSVDADHDMSSIRRNLDLIDSFYRGDGWYADGRGANYDYYVAWVMHFFTLMWCLMDGDDTDPSRAATYRERAQRYLTHFQLFFGSDGAPVYQGRSLIYRLALPGLLWLGARAGASPLSAGQTRRLSSGVLKHFVGRGAIENGTLTAGWYGSFPRMRQFYSGHGSTYWGSQGFAGLALAPDHPLWTAREEEVPIDSRDFCVAMPEPGFVLNGTSSDGIVRLANHKSDHFPFPVARSRASLKWRARAATAALLGRRHPPDPPPLDPHYRKLAYSSHAAPDQGAEPSASGIDSEIALIKAQPATWGRRKIHPVAVADRFACSFFYPSDPSLRDRIETVSLSRPGAEIRIHHVTSWGARVREGGFAVASDQPLYAATGDRWSTARRADGLTSFIAALHGYDGVDLVRREGCNPYGRFSATPVLSSGSEVIGEGVYASLVILGRDVVPDDELGNISFDVDGRRVTVRFGDGETIFVSLGAADVLTALVDHRVDAKVRYARVSPDGSVYVLRDV